MLNIMRVVDIGYNNIVNYGNIIVTSHRHIKAIHPSKALTNLELETNYLLQNCLVDKVVGCNRQTTCCHN